jgi:hypothetical protein
MQDALIKLDKWWVASLMETICGTWRVNGKRKEEGNGGRSCVYISIQRGGLPLPFLV